MIAEVIRVGMNAVELITIIGGAFVVGCLVGLACAFVWLAMDTD